MSQRTVPVAAPARPSATPRPRRRPRRFADPGRTWAKGLERRRPGLVTFVLEQLAERYGRPAWERRLDPTSELILTILTQNSADINAERAFEGLRAAFPSRGAVQVHAPGPGWGGGGLSPGAAPDWAAVETAPLAELIEAIRPGGLAVSKSPRIQNTLRTIRDERGDYSLEFLANMPPLEARDWLTRIDGVGKKTASVLLMFSFGMPLVPVDRHVERVSRRVGLIPPKATTDDAHDLFLALVPADRALEAHVNLIQHGRVTCHARRPDCAHCPLAPRCRYVDRRAP